MDSHRGSTFDFFKTNGPRPTFAAAQQLGCAWSKAGISLQIDGPRAKPTTRGRPCPLNLGQRTSRSATRIDASGSSGFNRKFKSTTVSQLSHAITIHGCLAVIAAEIVGQNYVRPLAERLALKWRTIANTSRSASQARCIRPRLSRISSFR